jgi:hypothetical protein
MATVEAREMSVVWSKRSGGREFRKDSKDDGEVVDAILQLQRCVDESNRMLSGSNRVALNSHRGHEVAKLIFVARAQPLLVWFSVLRGSTLPWCKTLALDMNKLLIASNYIRSQV